MEIRVTGERLINVNSTLELDNYFVILKKKLPIFSPNSPSFLYKIVIFVQLFPINLTMMSALFAA